MWVVTGASGFVGGAVLQRLNANGVEAVGLSRRAVPHYHRDALRKVLSGATGIVHAAAVVHQPHGDPQAHRFNVEGTRALIDAARDVGVRNFVFLSTIKVYGEAPPAHIDEQTPVAPEGPYAEAKVEAEEIVAHALDMRSVVLRLCPVFGRGDKGNVRTMIRAIHRRLFVVPGDGSSRKSIVHISTVAEAVAASVASSASGTFVLADRNAPTLRELADTIARVLGRRPPRSLPLPLIRLGARFVGAAARMTGRNTSFDVAQITKATTPTICDPSRLEDAMNIRCSVDLDATIRDEVAWLRGIGAL